MSDGEDEEQEKLITKLQIEYATGSESEVAGGTAPWDLGLLYLTNKSLWLVNREKEKTQIGLDSVTTMGEIVPRGESTTTKFTEVLGADHIIKIGFEPEDGGTVTAATLSASRDTLAALRDQLVVRGGTEMVSAAAQEQMSMQELMRKLAVLLELNINDEEQLSYLLGVDDKELVNLFIERSRLGVGT